MKNIKRIGCSFLILALMLSFIITNPIIAKADYTYRINIVLGGTGEENASFINDWGAGLSVASEKAVVKISGDKTVITIEGLDYNDEIIINPKSIVAINKTEDSYSKYYVKGIRRSGADAAPTKSAFVVTQDDSYVIAYGVGATVPYTVSYKDVGGNKLLETETFYAAEGEEIYIPYRYVDGYTPNTYNLHCSSVKANQAFEFIYTKGTAGGVINETRTETENISGGTTYSTVEGAPEYVYQTIPSERQQGVVNNRNTGGGQGEQDADSNEGGNAGGGAGGQNSEGIEDGETPTGIPDVIDITDEEVAKGIDEEAFKDNLIRYAIVLALIGIMAIIVVIVLSIKNRRSEEE